MADLAFEALNVVVYLRHPTVDAWCYTEQNRARFMARHPRARLKVCAGEEEFKSALGQAEVAVVWNFKQEWFELAPRLKYLATPAAGRDYLQVRVPERVRVRHGSFHGEIMAETVLGFMLGHCRGLFQAARSQQEVWPRRDLSAGMRPLRGSHLVVLGFGNIGRWVGRLAKPFGVRVTGIRRRVQPGDEKESWMEAEDRVLPMSELDAVLPEADHLVLVLPGGAETNQVMDARRLALLPAKAVVYNVGRGNALDEEALVQSLDAGRLQAAYLDVFSHEPLPPDSVLLKCPKVFRLPHLSAVAPNYLDLFMLELWDGLELHSQRE
jgi:phosphoglycerate dehydrogenase-like enzyme